SEKIERTCLEGVSLAFQNPRKRVKKSIPAGLQRPDILGPKTAGIVFYSFPKVTRISCHLFFCPFFQQPVIFYTMNANISHANFPLNFSPGKIPVAQAID